MDAFVLLFGAAAAMVLLFPKELGLESKPDPNFHVD